MIRKWDSKRGFGFIMRDDGEGDAFFHFSEVRKLLQTEVRTGMRVEFVETINPRNPARKMAANVVPIEEKEAGNGTTVPAKEIIHDDEQFDARGNRDGPQPLPRWLTTAAARQRQNKGLGNG